MHKLLPKLANGLHTNKALPKKWEGICISLKVMHNICIWAHVWTHIQTHIQFMPKI